MATVPLDRKALPGRRSPKSFIQRFLRPRYAIPAMVLGISVVELAVVDRKYGVFTGGFGQSQAVDTAPEFALFAAGYVVSQLALALLLWALCARLNRRSGAWATSLNFAFAFGGGSLMALTGRYQLHSYFSDAVDYALVKQLGGGTLTGALLYGIDEVAIGAAAVALFVLAWWTMWRLAKRFLSADGTRPHAPGRRSIAAAAFFWLILLVAIPRTGSDAALGLRWTLAWSLVEQSAASLTDFDRDGYGMFGSPSDSRPFDGLRHPLALDVPGNGIDEDGYAGDLKLLPVPAPRPSTVVPAGGPNVIVVLMESTRSDVLGKRIDGKPVAPNLEAVAATGAGIHPSYSHVGFTSVSLKTIFSGQLAPHPGDPSLFSELKASGYGVNVFSGLAEDFGGISETVAMRRSADIFVDAEKLRDQRAFKFASQSSLMVDEGIILNEFDRKLGRREQWAIPQFVYFNFQSPHFPYDQPAMSRRFADPPLPRAEISNANRARLERTYWNAVAHADAALGALVAKLKALGVWNNTILIVSGDHGESLFEDGFLGHGHIINQRQFGTFLVANRRLPGVTAPLAISDYRAILLDLLTGRTHRSEPFLPFMHIGELDRPSTIGLAGTPFGIVSLRLDRGEACFERPARCTQYAKLSGAEKQSVDAVVARWGSERWAARQRRRGSAL